MGNVTRPPPKHYRPLRLERHGIGYPAAGRGNRRMIQHHLAGHLQAAGPARRCHLTQTGNAPTLALRTPRPSRTYLVPTPSFTRWLEDRPPEVPDIGTLALLIARAGRAGVSLDRLRGVVRASPETLDNLLRALLTAGQVVVVQIGGEMRYRAAM